MRTALFFFLFLRAASAQAGDAFERLKARQEHREQEAIEQQQALVEQQQARKQRVKDYADGLEEALSYAEGIDFSKFPQQDLELFLADAAQEMAWLSAVGAALQRGEAPPAEPDAIGDGAFRSSAKPASMTLATVRYRTFRTLVQVMKLLRFWADQVPSPAPAPTRYERYARLSGLTDGEGKTRSLFRVAAMSALLGGTLGAVIPAMTLGPDHLMFMTIVAVEVSLIGALGRLVEAAFYEEWKAKSRYQSWVAGNNARTAAFMELLTAFTGRLRAAGFDWSGLGMDAGEFSDALFAREYSEEFAKHCAAELSSVTASSLQEQQDLRGVPAAGMPSTPATAPAPTQRLTQKLTLKR